MVKSLGALAELSRYTIGFRQQLRPQRFYSFHYIPPPMAGFGEEGKIRSGNGLRPGGPPAAESGSGPEGKLLTGSGFCGKLKIH